MREISLCLRGNGNEDSGRRGTSRIWVIESVDERIVAIKVGVGSIVERGNARIDDSQCAVPGLFDDCDVEKCWIVGYWKRSPKIVIGGVKSRRDIDGCADVIILQVESSNLDRNCGRRRAICLVDPLAQLIVESIGAFVKRRRTRGIIRNLARVIGENK